MNKFDTILFDLDGTLTDPKEGITKSIQYALAKYGIEVDDLDTLIPFIGPPLYDSFKEYYGFDQCRVREAVEYYREYFSKTGMYENIVYQGIPELLKELGRAGRKLVIATSKPTVFTEEILKHFDIYDAFSLIVGSNLDGTRISKPEVIGYILESLPGLSTENVVMVGDRKYDIKGAKSHGIPSIAVTYGYGTEEELQAENPDYIVNSIEELRQVLLTEK